MVSKSYFRYGCDTVRRHSAIIDIVCGKVILHHTDKESISEVTESIRAPQSYKSYYIYDNSAEYEMMKECEKNDYGMII